MVGSRVGIHEDRSRGAFEHHIQAFHPIRSGIQDDQHKGGTAPPETDSTVLVVACLNRRLLDDDEESSSQEESRPQIVRGMNTSSYRKNPQLADDSDDSAN